MKNYSIKKTLNDVAVKSFASQAQAIDFSDSIHSAATINSWVEENTNSKIKDLILPSSLNGDTWFLLTLFTLRDFGQIHLIRPTKRHSISTSEG